MKEINVRGIVGNDLISVCKVANAALPAEVVTPELFAQKVFLDINFDPSGVLVAQVDGKIVGFIVAYIRSHPMEDMPDDSDKCWITLFGVHPDYQNRGIGNELLNQVESWFGDTGRKTIIVGTYAPNWWTPGVDISVYPNTITWLEKRGYIQAVSLLSMDLDLVKYRRPEWIQDKENMLTAEGVIFQDSQPELIPALFDFLKREFPGDWQRYVRETLSKVSERGATYSQVQLAVDGSEIIGFTHHNGERFGPFGTAVSQRGRGMGAVLLCRTLQIMRNSGLHNAFFLSTDDKAAKLYAQAGFRESRRYALMKKEIR